MVNVRNEFDNEKKCYRNNQRNDRTIKEMVCEDMIQTTQQLEKKNQRAGRNMKEMEKIRNEFDNQKKKKKKRTLRKEQRNNK